MKTKWRFPILMGLICLLTISLAGCDSDGTPITFPDFNLEITMREAIGKPEGPIHKSDLASLIEFRAENRGISNLSGLENCINLTDLNLASNRISDISLLSSLTNLTNLSIYGNKISDISPLSNLTNLLSLHLGGNKITDISPLSSLTKLTDLDLASNQISDISCLSGLSRISVLYLYDNQINDISPLSSLTNLKELSLIKNPLAANAVDILIPQLVARGVNVEYESPPPPVPLAPARFVLSERTITPAEINIGEKVTISLKVTNTGDLSGSYKVSLKIDDAVVETKDVTLAGKASQTISFTVTKDVAGTYTVGIDGLSGTFKVKAAPANFTVTNLSISPQSVEAGRAVTISATVTNSGDSPGSYTAILYINASQEETKSITLNAGESQVVSFTVVKESIGFYHVFLDGSTGTFTVMKAVTPPSTDTVVYITETGAKYHRAGCQYLRHSSIPIERAEAIRRGYTPCSVCRP